MSERDMILRCNNALLERDPFICSISKNDMQYWRINIHILTQDLI